MDRSFYGGTISLMTLSMKQWRECCCLIVHDMEILFNCAWHGSVVAEKRVATEKEVGERIWRCICCKTQTFFYLKLSTVWVVLCKKRTLLVVSNLNVTRVVRFFCIKSLNSIVPTISNSVYWTIHDWYKWCLRPERKITWENLNKYCW